jgi:Na+/melibiose symporter-like transporter
VFEIGLPLIASCAALLMIFWYGLTEERSREIKGLLARRHEQQGADASPSSQERPTP